MPPSARPIASASSPCATSTSPTRASVSSTTPPPGSSAAGELVGELEKGGAQEITQHAVDYDADREELAEAVDEANEASSFDFGAD